MTISISEYEISVEHTDRLALKNLNPVLLGLFGEVGSIMSAAKKLHREKEAYPAYAEDLAEEFGDALWYLTALCRRLGFKLTDFVEKVSQSQLASSSLVAGNFARAPISHNMEFLEPGSMDELLLSLGTDAASLLRLDPADVSWQDKILEFVTTYLKAVQASGIPFSTIVEKNVNKVRGRFIEPVRTELLDFDCGFPDEERLPAKFRIEIKQRNDGRSYLRWNGVFIGDPLTDSIGGEDGYRFHDVFHFSHAAILHWSPTFRALIRHKRKSDPKIDGSQDSGRAIVIEEGLSAYIFSCAKLLNFFEGQNSVSLDLLKTVKNFVRGYEVERCSMKLWEDAILQGYAVFRKLNENNGGVVVGDRKKRTIRYEKLK